ncbi:MAG: hypothetical protein ACFCVC_11415 [Acidimicrobiia bacterium]
MVSIGLVVAACSGSAEPTVTVATTPPSTTTTTAVETTTTTTVATTTTSPAPSTTVAPEPPIPDTSGDDWTKIMTELYAFAGWLFQNPDSSLLGYLALPGSEVDLNLGGLLREYEAESWRELPGGGSAIREVALQSESGGRAVVLVIDDFDGSVAVDAEGTVVREDEDRPVSGFLWTLELGEDERWRLVAAEPLGPIDGFDE